MARGRVCATAGALLGAASVVLCVRSLQALATPRTIADGAYLRALFLGTPWSLLLATAGVIAALIGLVRSNGASAMAFVALAASVVAIALAAVLLLLAIGLLFAFV